SLNRVASYIDEARAAPAHAGAPLAAVTQSLDKLAGVVEPFATKPREPDPLAETWNELAALRRTLVADLDAFQAELGVRANAWAKAARDNAGLHAVRQALRPAADRCRDLSKQIDLAAKLSGRVIDIAVKDLEA